VGGEAGNNARICNYDWVLDIRTQCIEKKVAFHFKQTGARFAKGDHLYFIKRQDQHSQATKAGIDFGI
jgi:protein gp37